MNDNNVSCPFERVEGAFPPETPIGMAYVPFQQWEEPLPENTALENGTVFPSLVLPFVGKEVPYNDR